MSHVEHHSKARGPVRCAAITVSDTRTEETDTGGRLLKELLGASGHAVVHYEIIRDEPEKIRDVIETLSVTTDCQAIIFTGGTGISKRDRTFDVVDSMVEKRIPGFGEIFRYLSFQEIGSAAILSRAGAGVYQGRILVTLPGSPGGVRLGMERLVLPELAHMVWEANR
ncbi:MAG: MogA/MoaB family molybdenum cofactor biosynthesis protein [Acidobacteria bacterium]|nr:MogA/MoaB family molybdenum cofactor biosynthesis protein [Acidobacteriota bacterium]